MTLVDSLSLLVSSSIRLSLTLIWAEIAPWTCSLRCFILSPRRQLSSYSILMWVSKVYDLSLWRSWSRARRSSRSLICSFSLQIWNFCSYNSSNWSFWASSWAVQDSLSFNGFLKSWVRLCRRSLSQSDGLNGVFWSSQVIDWRWPVEIRLIQFQIRSIFQPRCSEISLRDKNSLLGIPYPALLRGDGLPQGCYYANCYIGNTRLTPPY